MAQSSDGIVCLLVFPIHLDATKGGNWVTRQLLSIASSRFGVAPALLDVSETPISLPLDSAVTVLLTPSFLLHDDPPWHYFLNLAGSGRPIFYEMTDSGVVLAAAFPCKTDPAIAKCWARHLSNRSLATAQPRPPLPQGSWVLSEAGAVSDKGFHFPLDRSQDGRRARDLAAVNNLVAELSGCPPRIPALAEQVGRSSVPWLMNSMLNELEYRSRSHDVRSTPREIHLSTTSACNIECHFCSYTHGNAIFRYLDTDAVNALGIYSQLEDLRLSAGLGEPTLNPHLPKIINSLRGNYPHLCLNLFTNGLAWSRKGLVDSFSRLTWINISLNAANGETWRELCGKDGFSRIQSNLTGLLEAKGERTLPHLYGSTVLNRRNIDELPHLPALCARLGIRRLTAIPYFALGYEGSGKLESDSTLDACRAQYAAVYDELLRSAEAAQVSIELPSPGHAESISFGVEKRRLHDFSRLLRANIRIERLLDGEFPEGTACPPLWRMTSIGATSRNHANSTVHGYLYPCLGPLSSHDFSIEMPIDFTSREQFFKSWNGPSYQGLRAGQSGLRPICEACAQSDSRSPRNFPLFLRLRKGAAFNIIQ